MRDVSIAIPAYNNAQKFEYCLKSIEKQDLKRVHEVLVSDNCSNEDLLSVIEKHKRAIPMLRYVRQPKNIGMVCNWNYCLQNSEGRYITILHNDDMLPRRSIQFRAEYLDHNPDIGLVGSRAIYKAVGAPFNTNMLINNVKALVKSLLNTTVYKNASKIYDKGDVKEFIMDNHHFPCSSVMLRREVVETVGVFDTSFPFTADEEYWARVLRYWSIARMKGFFSISVKHDANFEYETWKNKEFALNYAKLYFKLLQYCDFDPEFNYKLTQRLINSLKFVLKFISITQKNSELINCYVDLIKSLEERGLSGLKQKLLYDQELDL